MLLFLLILAMCGLVAAGIAMEETAKAQNELADLTRSDQRLVTELLRQARRQVDQVARAQEECEVCRRAGRVHGR